MSIMREAAGSPPVVRVRYVYDQSGIVALWSGSSLHRICKLQIPWPVEKLDSRRLHQFRARDIVQKPSFPSDLAMMDVFCFYS
jgi:hypothetical protein